MDNQRSRGWKITHSFGSSPTIPFEDQIQIWKKAALQSTYLDEQTEELLTFVYFKTQTTKQAIGKNIGVADNLYIESQTRADFDTFINCRSAPRDSRFIYEHGTLDDDSNGPTEHLHHGGTTSSVSEHSLLHSDQGSISLDTDIIGLVTKYNSLKRSIADMDAELGECAKRLRGFANDILDM